MRPNTEALRCWWMTGRISLVFLKGAGKGVVKKKFSRATRWQSGLELITTSVAAVPSNMGFCEQAVPIGALRFWRVRFPAMPLLAAKKKTLFLIIGPPKLHTNQLRKKTHSDVSSHMSAASTSDR